LLILIDRLAADRSFYSGKHHRHGMILQVIAAPDGEIVWVSGPLPSARILTHASGYTTRRAGDLRSLSGSVCWLCR